MNLPERIRQTVNFLNLSTPLGLLIARVGGAQITSSPDGVFVALGYRLGFPIADAFTVGSVIIVRITGDEFASRPELRRHEARHSTQYAICLGVVMLPLYVTALAASWVLCGDIASYNPFERLAGLADGGYTWHPLRAIFGGSSAGRG